MSVVRSIVTLVGVGSPPPRRTEPVGAAPASAFRSPATPPVLKAAIRASASLWEFFRATVIVSGALAVAPLAVFIVAVAENVSAAGCAEVIDAAAATTAPARIPLIVFCNTLMCRPSARNTARTAAPLHPAYPQNRSSGRLVT